MSAFLACLFTVISLVALVAGDVDFARWSSLMALGWLILSEVER